MDILTATTLTILDEVHADLRHVLQDLPAEALNWQPGPDTSSLYVLMTHLLGAEHFWLSAAAAGPIERDRDAEFRASGTDPAPLLELLDEADRNARAALSRITPETLASSIMWRDEPRTGAWCLLHAVEHCGQHRGQALMTRQLWEQRRANGA